MKAEQPKVCIAERCDETLEGRQSMYCSHRCKQAVKYAIKTGRQCRNCGRLISKPVPTLGGYNKYCKRTKACRDLHASAK
jgi:hypothetical protein